MYIKLMKRFIPTELLELLENWMSGCFAYVKWNDSYSFVFSVCSGVRQGAVFEATPRPIKLVLETEAHKEQVLESAKKLEEDKGRRFCQDIYSSRPNSKGKRSTEKTRRRVETKKSQRREGPHNRQREDSGEKNIPILNGSNAEETQLRCFYTNADRILGKFEEFKRRIVDCHIVGVVETWLNEDISDAE